MSRLDLFVVDGTLPRGPTAGPAIARRPACPSDLIRLEADFGLRVTCRIARTQPPEPGGPPAFRPKERR
ncbi:hypothetical protein ABZ137_31525 [Streptomyces bobili]|uniref:hypothetical protein n=1 Tax=Streptomyces bobili TaxID=67280 RepID=UPI00339F08CD